MIEKSKYNRLAKAAYDREMTPVYICSTPKGIWGFSLPKHEITWEDREMPATTDFEDKRTITKTVGYLDTALGFQFA